MRELSFIPPNGSLLNPRNQCTSPLPEKKFLLPYARAEYDEEEAPDTGSVSLLGLLREIPIFFDVKRNADLDAERQGVARPPLIEAMRERLLEASGREEEPVQEQMAALRYACALHHDHPKVALFQSMAGWADAPAWDATKAAACLLLTMWLKPPEDDATKVSARLTPGRVHSPSTLAELNTTSELKISDLEMILKHLQRHRLVSAAGAKKLSEVARELVLPPPPPPAPPRDEPVVSVDELLLRWFSAGVWGTWGYTEDRALLMSITSKFQPSVRPRSPSAKSPARSPEASPAARRPPRF